MEPECLHAGNPDSPCQGEVVAYMRFDGRVFPMCDKHLDAHEEAEEKQAAFMQDAHEHAYANGYEEEYWGDEY